MKKNIFFPFIIVLFAACNGKNLKQYDNNLLQCPKKPTAIFAPTMRTVTKHEFLLTKTESTERVKFDDGGALEIVQSGCEKVQQEFRFILPPDPPYSTGEEWAQVVAGQFQKLSGIEPKLMGFMQWAEQINAQKERFKIGEPLQIGGKQVVKISVMPSKDLTLLTVNVTEP